MSQPAPIPDTAAPLQQNGLLDGYLLTRPLWFKILLYLVFIAGGWFVTAMLIQVTGWTTLGFSCRLSFLIWAPYAGTAPLVWLLARKFPLGSGLWARHLGVHLVGAALFLFACDWVHHRVMFNVVGPPPPNRMPLDGPPGRPFGEDENWQRPIPPPPPPHDEFMEPRPMNHSGPQPGHKRAFPPLQAHINLPVYMLIVSISHLLGYSQRLRQRDLAQQKLLAELSQARLQSLQSQLQPHFLFNTLNTISALVHEQPQAADDMLQNLADLLRINLDQNQKPETSLRLELVTLSYYLDIQKIRFGDRLRLSRDIQQDVEDCLVPTFILQPLVENAIQHGIASRPEGGSIHLEAYSTSETLHLIVEDDGAGFSPESPRIAEGGIGLSNTRARLQTLYGAKHQLTLSNRKPHGTRIEMIIPLRRTANPSAQVS